MDLKKIYELTREKAFFYYLEGFPLYSAFVSKNLKIRPEFFLYIFHIRFKNREYYGDLKNVLATKSPHRKLKK